MATKKVFLLIGFLVSLAISTVAQETTGSYDWRDSSLIPSKRLGQHNEFLNNQYHYPAKPRDQWELGIKVGNFHVNGDVPAQLPMPGFAAHVRKSLGYVFSVRAEYLYGIGRGVNWKARTSGFADHWRNAGYPQGGGTRVFDNYRTTVQDLSIQAVASLNSIRFHKGTSKVLVYALGGVGATIYDTKTNVTTDNGALYNFSSVTSNVYKDRRQTIRDVKNILDGGSYTTDAENHGDAGSRLFGQTLRFSKTVGVGVTFKLSEKVNLSLEDRITYINDDLLDGVRWQNVSAGPTGTARVLTPEYDTYNYLSVGLNINLGSRDKRTEPLWWINPLDYAYSELNSPKHMKLPKPILDDADGDGVPDQFDMEPNTPAGAPVDSHGVSRDTDGDGVPDYKDKELITPTICQPVDADGVGKCPCPDESCFEGYNLRKGSNCGIGDLPNVSFSARSYRASRDAEAVLASVADRLRQNPDCKIVVTSYTCEPSKSSQQLSWDRVNTVINYLVEKQGISADRLVFKYGESGGDCNTVDLRAAEPGDEGPNTVPAPHPNLRRR
ncbi:MAG: OmpA family protein [Chitinophagaceae bacterium]|nr:OmpA family protein [Chitinophagaceae bacterium]MCW5925866.1 OmpA family protein [Chitinophagaceae bacterium]